MLLIEHRIAWHEKITDELVREACKKRKGSLEDGTVIAGFVEIGQPVPQHLREKATLILREGHPMPGFCLHCGQQWEGIEPDARFEMCLDCGAPEVFGCDEVLKAVEHG